MRILFLLNNKNEISLVSKTRVFFSKKSISLNIDFYNLDMDDIYQDLQDETYEEKRFNLLNLISNYRNNNDLLENFKFNYNNGLKISAKKKLITLCNDFYNYDLICFSSYDVYFYDQLLISLYLKKINNNIKILFGGPNIIMDEIARNILKQFEIDYSIGYVESSIYDFIYDYNNFYIKQHTVDINSFSIDDVQKYSIEELEYLDYEITLATSSGCGNACKFCSNPKTNNKYKSIPIDTLVQWIKYYNNIGIKKIILNDASFNFINFDDFVEQMIIIKNKIIFDRLVFLEFYKFNKDISKKMYDAGFRNVFFGIECLSKENQERFNKKMPSYLEVYNIIKSLVDNNIFVVLSGIYGFPNQSNESFTEEFLFLKKIKEEFKNKIKIHMNEFFISSDSYIYKNIDKYEFNIKYLDSGDIQEFKNIFYNNINYQTTTIKKPNEIELKKMEDLIDTYICKADKLFHKEGY